MHILFASTDTLVIEMEKSFGSYTVTKDTHWVSRETKWKE